MPGHRVAEPGICYTFLQDQGSAHNRQQRQGLDSKGDISISEEQLFIVLMIINDDGDYFLLALDEVEPKKE